MLSLLLGGLWDRGRAKKAFQGSPEEGQVSQPTPFSH